MTPRYNTPPMTPDEGIKFYQEKKREERGIELQSLASQIKTDLHDNFHIFVGSTAVAIFATPDAPHCIMAIDSMEEWVNVRDWLHKVSDVFKDVEQEQAIIEQAKEMGEN